MSDRTRAHDESTADRPPYSREESARFDAFVDHLVSTGRRAPTLYSYRKDWEDFCRWYARANGEPFNVGRITAMDVADYRGSALAERHKPATINRRLIFIKRYVDFCLARQWTRPETSASVRAVPRVRMQPLAPKSMDRSETRQLLKEVELRAPLRDKAIIHLMLFSGLRVGELVCLERSDVALSPHKGTITIRAEIAKGGKQRLVPVPLAARKVLTEYLAGRNDTSPALFTGQRGPIHEDAVVRIVQKYALKAGLRVSPHKLRHTFAFTYLGGNSNDLVGLASILGHESLQTTRIYTQKRLADLQEGVENVRYC